MQWKADHVQCQLLDVREDFEREDYHIGGMHIPMGDVLAQSQTIPQNIPVVVYCRKGVRSAIIIQRLEGLGYTNLYNLSGGIEACRLAGG